MQYLNVYTENKQDPFYIFHVAEGDYQRIIHQIEIACIAKSSIRALGEAYSMETERLPEEKFSEIRFWLPGEEIAVFSPEIEPNIAPIQFAEDTSTFYFPFDRRSSSFAISAPVQISNSQTSTLIIPTSPRLSLKIEAPNWTNQIEKTTEYLGFDPVIKLVFNSQKEETESDQDEMEFIGEEPVTNISIVQHRPLSQRILTAVLLTSLLIFILSLLFIQETGTFLEVAVGILLGLWGVQDILIPSYITGPTLINTLILAFYVLLAFVAAINFAIRPLWHRLGPPSPAPPPDPEPPTPPPTPEPPAPTPVIVQPQKGVLQWVTAVSATITALLTFLHFIRRKD